jgi:MoxR-like ATPase
MASDIQARTEAFRADFQKLRDEIGRVIVGHDEVVEGVLTAMFVGGHCLLEGVPGLGKTMLVSTVAQVMDLTFNRIQFTPDLMPADILGTNLISEGAGGERAFRFQKGPVFAQIVLADEINRATPKTQSALLEVMQEKAVTFGGVRHELEEPFFVLATQNPIDMEGTYPLPEAQMDRFLFKLLVRHSSREQLAEVLTRTTENVAVFANKVMDGPRVLEHRTLVRDVVAAEHVKDYAVRLVMATRPKEKAASPMANKYVRFGASPRGAQALILAAKVQALLDKRYNVAFDDIAKVARPALRHRLILNFEGEAEGVATDRIVEEILEVVPRQADAAVKSR